MSLLILFHEVSRDVVHQACLREGCQQGVPLTQACWSNADGRSYWGSCDDPTAPVLLPGQGYPASLSIGFLLVVREGGAAMEQQLLTSLYHILEQ